MGDLTALVKDLIDSHREDDLWDFKREHHRDKAALVHDITCMANTCTNRDCYIIFGVEDKTFSVVGVEHDDYRRNQQNIVDILRSVNYAGGARPRIEMRTIELENHEIDVLIVKNTHDVPYYLAKPYQDDKVKSQDGKKIGKTVFPFHIYTRVVDTNTPIDGNADINHVEYLWRKRFGIDLPPKERLLLLLDDIDKWNVDWANKRYAYHSFSPEFQMIQADELKEGWEPEAAFYLNPIMHFARLNLIFHDTILHETELWCFGGATFLPKAERCSVPGRWGTLYSFYRLDTIEGKLLKIFTKGSLNISSCGRSFHQFLIFENEEEKQDFDCYLQMHFNDYPDDEIRKRYDVQIREDNPQNGGGRSYSAFSIAKCAKLYEDWKNQIQQLHIPELNQDSFSRKEGNA